ncbi:MAG: amino acid ABC transporter permease [Mesorhizobium sp.]
MIREFGFNEFLFIIAAIKWTVALSAIAFTGGAAGGLLVALARVAEARALRFMTAAFILFFQGTPLLMQLFLVYFGAAVLGYNISAWAAAAIGLTLHASAYLGEIWRGCIQAVPRGQTEAATALGLGYVARMRYVVLPQALKIALAPTVGFLVQLIKGTSLASIIGFVELTRAGQIINTATFEPLLVFSIVGAAYFALCWPLSAASYRLEARYSQSGTRSA